MKLWGVEWGHVSFASTKLFKVSFIGQNLTKSLIETVILASVVCFIKMYKIYFIKTESIKVVILM